MITLKYKKTGSAAFISHIDVLRNMVRIMRRAKFEIGFSQGFNPHMLLFFSPPLALGVSSLTEYVTADVKNVTPEEFVRRFNAAASEGFYGIEAFESTKSPNLAANIVAAEYFFPLDLESADKIVMYFETVTKYVLHFSQKGKDTEKEVRNQILGVRAEENGLFFTLATGNDNLRADRLAANLNTDFGLDINVLKIVKTTQFVRMGEKLVNADEMLKGRV